MTLITVTLGRLDLARNESSAQSFEVNCHLYTNNLNRETTVSQVSEVFVHPDYNTNDYANDIAIIRLSADAIFNYYVQPICLWKADKTDISEVVGKMGTVVGWGLTENGTTSGVLQQAHFLVEDFFTCVKSNPSFFGRILTVTNFCAGYRNGSIKLLCGMEHIFQTVFVTKPQKTKIRFNLSTDLLTGLMINANICSKHFPNARHYRRSI